MNKNQVKGRVTKAKGRTKEVAGKLFHKPALTAKGKLEKVTGTAQAAYGDLQSVAGKQAASAKRAIDQMRRAIKKR